MALARVPGGYADPRWDVARVGGGQLLSYPQAVGVATVEGEMVMLNDAAVALLGWPPEQLAGRGWIERIYADPDEQRAAVPNLEQMARATALPRRHGRTIVRADGSRALLDMLAMPVSLDDGTPAAFLVCVDATRAAAPIASDRGFREMVEDSPDVLSRIEIKSGRYLFVSRAIETTTGYSPAELYADPGLTRARLLPEYRESFERAVRAVARGEPQWLTVEFRRKDGTAVALHQALYPIRDASGRVVAVEGVARDITAVRALERRLQQTVEELRARNEELASLDRLKSQLLANVSHELRTPLVTIKGYNELILRGSLGPLTARQKRALEIASSSTERLVDLIESLLDFARREEGRLTLKRARLDLRAPIREAIEQFEPRIAGKGLSLFVELGEQPLEIDGDRGRLAQVMKALLSNAEKFCDPPGRITVSARRERGELVIEVGDTGVGIPSGAQSKIFERFYQVDSSATRRFGGAGLGLALAREIVGLHGGTIAVESTEGRGSLFRLRLPASAPAPPLRDNERPVVLLAAAPPRLGPLRDRLEAEGLAVLEAGSGAEVLRRARRHRPDAVVLALDEGLRDALAALRHDAETETVPAIAIADGAVREALLPLADLVVGADEPARVAGAIRRLVGRPVPEGRAARVLVVDDEPEIVDFTRFVLEREGFTVVAAGSGEAALAESARLAASDQPLDLVVLDVALEGIDGIEICRRLKAHACTARVPVLMLTAMSGDDVRHGAYSAGADGFLTKPFGVEEFLRQVRLHLRA